MNKKIIASVIGVIVLGIILFYTFKSKPESGVPAESTQAATTDEIKASAEVIPNKDQELINTYTTQINAGNINNGDTYYQRGLIYLRLRQDRAAVQDFTNALKYAPDSPYAYYGRALAYIHMYQYDQALPDLADAIKFKADYADAFNARGLIYVEKNQYDDAIADYNSAISINQSFVDAYFNLGTLYARMKDYEQAKAAFSQAISNSSTASDASAEQIATAKKKLMEAYLNRANVELQLGDLQAALDDTTFVVTNDAQNVNALKLRAAVYERMGNSAAAAADTASADSLGFQNMLNNH